MGTTRLSRITFPSAAAFKKYDIDMFYIAGPGHGDPAVVAMFTWKAPQATCIRTDADHSRRWADLSGN